MQRQIGSPMAELVDVATSDGENKLHESQLSRTVTTGSYVYLFFVIGLVQGIIGSSLLALQQHSHTSEGKAGTLVLARGLGWLGGSMASGYLLVRFDAHRLLIAALALMLTSHVAVPFLAHFSALFAAFGAIGVAGGVLEAGGNTVLIWLWREQVGPLLQFLNFAIGVGALIAPLLMAAFLTEESLEFSVLSSYVSLAILMFPPIVVLASYRSPPEFEPVEDVGSPVKRSLAILICMCLFAVASSGIEISTSSWLPLFAKDSFGWSPAKCDLTTTVFYLGFTSSRLVFSFVSSRVLSPPRSMFLLIALLVAGVGMLVYSALVRAGMTLFVSICVLGFGLGPLFAIGLSLPIESPAHYLISAKDVALVVAASNAGELATPLVLSLSWSAAGPMAFLGTSSVMTAGTVACGSWLYWLCYR